MARLPEIRDDCIECGGPVWPYSPYDDNPLLCWGCLKRIQEGREDLRPWERREPPRPRRPGWFERAGAAVVLGAIAATAVGAAFWVWRLVLG